MYELLNRFANLIRTAFGLPRVYRLRARTGRLKAPFGRL